jgi:hypothetical protein
MQSTSGVHVDLAGPLSRFPVIGVSKKQTAVSHSTPEAQIVAGAFGWRTEGIPALQLLEAISATKPTLRFQEYNQAMIRICETGKKPTMRHLGRTHGVSVAWLHERMQDGDVGMSYCDTSDQSADVYTKTFGDPQKWAKAHELVGVIDPRRLIEVIQNHILRQDEIASGWVRIKAKLADAAPCSARGVGFDADAEQEPATALAGGEDEGGGSAGLSGATEHLVSDNGSAGLPGATKRLQVGTQRQVSKDDQVAIMNLVRQIEWPEQKRAVTKGR